MKADHDHQHEKARDYHDTDIRARPLVAFVVLTTIFIVVTFFGVIVFYRFMGRDVGTQPSDGRFSDLAVLPPEPRLQVVEKRSLEEQREMETKHLTSYGWVDKQAGVVHIPIDQALKLAAERAGAATGK
jgi:hypothetical protein